MCSTGEFLNFAKIQIIFATIVFLVLFFCANGKELGDFHENLNLWTFLAKRKIFLKTKFREIVSN
jgi:hypothetical protein